MRGQTLRTDHIRQLALLESAAKLAQSREALWAHVITSLNAETVAEVGVWKGEFAAALLQACPGISKYIAIDPWAHQEEWIKPFNVSCKEFESIYRQAMSNLSFAKGRLHVVRKTTMDAGRDVPRESLDFCYIDGDHTLRGITIDAITCFDWIKDGGILAGDDFGNLALQHGIDHEPTLVFPFMINFAEAKSCTIVALPFNQFALLVNRSSSEFQFVNYANTNYPVTLKAVLVDSLLKGARPGFSLTSRALARFRQWRLFR